MPLKEDLKSRSDEILSGTVIDSNVIHPTIDEFYLQASVNSDSNFQPTKFSIVYTDEMYASLALFERWTFGLCWNSQNNCSALNIPSVLSSAEKYAQRGRQLLKQFFDRGKNFDFTRTLEDRSKKLNYSKIEKLRNKNIVD
uniref:Piwi domain-containing protein n=1 Tax=Panagrolaimus sp. PS1159 TaxID=55785 RepID=A0AC35EWS4_9BILA